MPDSIERLEALVGCLLQVIGRTALPVEKVREIVGEGKQLKAFNLCDGTMTQTQIRRKLNIDAGNFSRTAQRWIQNGVAFEIGDGNESRVLHIYTLPAVVARTKSKR